MKKRSVCLLLAALIFSGCGLQLPSDRQDQTNKRLDRLHKDFEQLHRDLQQRPR